MPLLREPLLLLSRSDVVKRLVSTMPVSAGIVRSYVPGESTEAAVDATAGLVDDDLRVDPRLPRRGHPRRRAGRRHGGGVRRRPQGALRARPDPQRRGVGEAVRDRPGAPGHRPQDRPRERPHDLPRRPQRRHHGDPRHGGPHHHRLDAGDAARAAQGLPRDRRRPPGLPPPHRGRLPRAGLRGLARPAVQGRVQRARGGRLPGAGSTSTGPTSAASRCCWPARATR